MKVREEKGMFARPSTWKRTTAMPDSVRALADVLAAFTRAHPIVAAPVDEETLVALDHAAAHLVAALTRFVDEPVAVFPAQRALSLVGGRRDAGKVDLTGALSAFQDLDEGQGALGRGLSRLLESALDAKGVGVVERLRADALPSELQALARALDTHGAILSAVDDLAHALSLSSENAVAAVFLEALLELVLPSDAAPTLALDVGVQWLRHRRAKGPLLRLFVFRHALDALDDEDVALSARAGIAPSLALWIVGERVVRRDAIARDDDDRAALTALFESAALAPLEVLDAADLLKSYARD